MRMRLYLVGVCLLFVGGAAMALGSTRGLTLDLSTVSSIARVIGAAPGVVLIGLGAALIAAGMWALIAAGRCGTGEPQASREPPSGE